MLTWNGSPGPWRRDLVSTKRDRTHVYGIRDATGKRICDVREYDDKASSDIAAITMAPEMVKALKGLMAIAEMAMPDTFFQTDARVGAARNILRKLKEA